MKADAPQHANLGSGKKHGRVWRVLLALVAALLACALVFSGFSLISNRVGATYNDLGATERAVLDQYGKLFDAVENDGETLWADDPLTKRPIAAIGRPGSYDTLLINPTKAPNPLTSVRIAMPENSPLTVYRIASVDPGALTKSLGVANFDLGSIAGNDAFYVKLSGESVSTKEPSGRFIYLLTHESLHSYMQGNWPRGGQFVEGLRKQDMHLIYEQIDQLDIMQRQIESGQPDNQALQNALQAFVTCADNLKKTSPQYAKLAETKYTDEGTAEYVGIRAEQLVGEIQPHVLENGNEGVEFAQVGKWLKDGSLGGDFLMGRNYPYGVGALLCQVFDQLGETGWQERLNAQTTARPVTVVDIARDLVQQ